MVNLEFSLTIFANQHIVNTTVISKLNILHNISSYYFFLHDTLQHPIVQCTNGNWKPQNEQTNKYSNFIPKYICIYILYIRERHQKLPDANCKLYFSRTKQKWNKLVKFTSCTYNFGYESNIVFHSEKKLECQVVLLDGVTTWDENNSCSLKNLQLLLQPRQLRYLCAIVALSVSLLWKVGGLWFPV